MPIVFACAASHAPGMTAWTEAAPKEQAVNILGSYRKLGAKLAASKPDAIVALTVEHWANFFLNSMPSFCIGRAEHYDGPVEEWLRIPKARVPGDAQLGKDLIDACLDGGFDPTFSDELLFDHATFFAAAFPESRLGRARRASHHQHLDAPDADGEPLFCARPISREGLGKKPEENCHDRHWRFVALARRSQAR